MEISNQNRAQVLVQALPYIQKYAGKTVVVKYGGNAMINNELKDAVMSDLVLMQLVGINVVLVHGGGPEITAMLKKIGKESKFVGGMRYTDEEWSLRARSIKTSSSSWSSTAARRSGCAVWTAVCSRRKKSLPRRISALWARSRR